jgi:hypothetical protein
VLKKLEGRGEIDPQYWSLLIGVGAERGADAREIARRGLRVLADPSIAAAAASRLLPKWGGSPQEFVAFADEAAQLTRKTYGDAVYTAFVSRIVDEVLNGDGNFDDYEFDWERARRGGREAIAMSPQWIPSYHRLALLAFMFKDRATLAELFAKKELGTFDDKVRIWRNSSRYFDAMKLAGVEPPRTAAIAPPVLPPPPASTAPRVDTSRWPQMLLQTKLVYGGVTHDRIAAFLVKTERGLVAVSAVPPLLNQRDSDKVIENVRAQLGSWTMFAPSQPKRLLTVASFLTDNAPNFQLGVALEVNASAAKPVVSPLRMRSFTNAGELGPLYVVGCTWESGRCRQTVYEGRATGTHESRSHALRMLGVGVAEILTPANFSGAAVVDANGDVVAVATARGGSTSSQFKTIISADVLDTIVP